MSRVVALTLAAALGALVACGVKAPPRAPGAPEKAPPSDVLEPAKEPRR